MEQNYSLDAALSEAVQSEQASGQKSQSYSFDIWSNGKRIVLIGACIAIVSMCIVWFKAVCSVKSMDYSTYGFSSWAMCLLALYIYPCIALFRKPRIDALWGVLCALSSAGAAAFLMINVSRRVDEIYRLNSDQTIVKQGIMHHILGPGGYLFIVGAILLGIGSVMDYVKSGGKIE